MVLNTIFDGQNIVLSNYYLVDPNSLDDKARYLIKINLEGQIFENYQHLQYQENAYSSCLIYFGKYKGKDLYGGFLPTQKRLGYDLLLWIKMFWILLIHNRKILIIQSLASPTSIFLPLTENETIVICAQKIRLKERNYLFARSITDMAQKYLLKRSYILYPNPVKIDQSWFEYPMKAFSAFHASQDYFIPKTHQIKQWELIFSSYPNGLYFCKINSQWSNRYLQVG